MHFVKHDDPSSFGYAHAIIFMAFAQNVAKRTILSFCSKLFLVLYIFKENEAYIKEIIFGLMPTSTLLPNTIIQIFVLSLNERKDRFIMVTGLWLEKK